MVVVRISGLRKCFRNASNNKTNAGVTPRRWLLVANPVLAGVITEAIGRPVGSGISTQIVKLETARRGRGIPADAFRDAKRGAKMRFIDWLAAATGQSADPESIFDSQIKRIHEYKRQLLNALHIIVLYNRLRNNPNLEVPPRTFFFAGKAAPAYQLAKLIIKFINNLATVVDADPVTSGRIKIIFLPDYGVSVAERLIPASDVSEQISTAGYEASGTSNMKFMMNGALTIGHSRRRYHRDGRGSRRRKYVPLRLDRHSSRRRNLRGWYRNPYWHYDNQIRKRERRST